MRPSRARLWGFSLVLLLGVLGAAELLLHLPFLARRLPAHDPTGGFAPRVELFRRDGPARVLREEARGAFNPVRVLAERPAGSIRVVCLGGSSAYGYPWGASVSFSRFLENRLRAMATPGTTVEVINLAAMSYGSHRIEGLLDTALALEPDLVVLYSGHNEFVEAAAYERLLEGGEAPLRIRQALGGVRLYALLARGATALRAGLPSSAPADPDDLFGFRARRNESRIFTLEEKRRVIAAYEQRVRSIGSRCAQSGTPLVLATVPSNARDWKPEFLAFTYPLAPDAARAFLRHLAEGIRQLQAGDPGAALEALDRAEAIENRLAVTAYHRAQAAAAAGRSAEAARDYRRARDLDVIPIRAPTGINEAIRRVASEDVGVLVDVVADLEGRSPDGVLGREWILDYCHPTVRGHQRIAELLARSVVEHDLVPSLADDAAERLARYAPDGETAPPDEALPAGVLWWMGLSESRQHRDAEALRYWELGRAKDPDHPRILRQLAGLYARSGESGRARDALERLVELPEATLRDRLGLVDLALAQGDLDEARRLTAELSYHDAGPDAELSLREGEIAARSSRWSAARSHFETAVRLRPEHYLAHQGVGRACRALGDRDCALRAYRSVLELTNYSPSARAALDELEAEDGARDDAPAGASTEPVREGPSTAAP